MVIERTKVMESEPDTITGGWTTETKTMTKDYLLEGFDGTTRFRFFFLSGTSQDEF